MTALWVSGLDHPWTGVGVIQRRLYETILASNDIELRRGPDRPIARTCLPSLGYKIRQLAAPTAGCSAAIVTTSPAPIRLAIPSIAFVYDLRWLRTAGPAKQWFRRRDLRRTAHRADHILTISRRTLDDLGEELPEVMHKASILPLGPGQVERLDFSWREPGTVMLVGAAPHKRNLELVEALARSEPPWLERIIGVSIGEPTKQRALEVLGAARCEFYDAIDASTLIDLYRRSEVYASLSIEEGFGLPYIEALVSGCQVLAIDQPLTRELLGDAAILIADGPLDRLVEQLAEPLAMRPDATRRARAECFSWSNTSHEIIDRVSDLISESS